MAVKITEKALRDFVKKMLIEQQRGDDSEREPTDPPAVSNIPFDQPDTPLEAQPHVTDTTLGPPIADPGYVPQNPEDLKASVQKMLDDVPESAIPTAYKIVRKSLDNLHSVLRQRATISPDVEVVLPGDEFIADSPLTQEEEPVVQMSEDAKIARLLGLIFEQGYNEPGRVSIDSLKDVSTDDDPSASAKLSGEEDEEVEDEEEIEVRTSSQVDAPQPPGRRVYSVEPTKSGPASYTGQADEVEDEVEIDPDLAKLLGDQPRRMTARDREQDRKAKEDAAQKSAEQSKVAAATAEKAAEEKLKIAKLLYKDEKALSSKLDNLEDAMMLDSLLTPEQVFEVEEEFAATDTASEIKSGGARSFSDMSEEQRGKFAEILLDMQKSISNSAFRNIRDAGFMKFLHALTIGPDVFQDRVLSITQEVPADAAPIQKFLLKALPWSAEFKKEVKSAGSFPSFDEEAASDILKYLSQNEEGAKEGGSLLDDYTSLVHYYLAFKNNFPGSEKSMRKFHFNKDNGKDALTKAVDAMVDRDDRESYEVLRSVLAKEENKKEVEKQLGKGFLMPSFKSAVAEAMTPAEAILRSNAVSPDLDKALEFVKSKL